MNPVQLLAHFNRISDAPDAIPSLRRFILELAVRGKLVVQDPRDEPASELLKRIKDSVRIRKVSGEFREPRNTIEIPFESLPFNVPSAWTWGRLVEIADVSYGFAFDSLCFNSNKVGMPLIRIRDISDTDTEAYYDGDFDQAYVVRKGDYLVGMDGDFNVRKWKGRDALLNQRVMRIKNWRAALVADFLAIPLQMILDHLHTSTSQTTVKHLSAKQANGIYLPLPPLAEQHRIVAKVDELMALCDRLEAAQAERESRRDRLATASLQRLNQPSGDTPSFREHARFHLRHLSRLTARPEKIQQLRQTILNLAVRGKLVPQDSNDEPAAVLLNRIQAEKARLLKRDIGSPHTLTSSDLSGSPFEQPSKWETVALGEVCNLVTSGSRGWAEFYSDTGPKFIRAQNIRFGRLRLDDLACVKPPKRTEGTRTQISKGDLLIVITGAGVTNPALLDQELGEAYVSQHVALVRPTETSLSRWLLFCLMSPSGGRAELVDRAYGAGKPGLNLDNIRSLNIPLPPLAEQHRIVAKVDELLALCNQLEAQLTTAQTESRRLLEAVLHEALAVA